MQHSVEFVGIVSQCARAAMSTGITAMKDITTVASSARSVVGDDWQSMGWVWVESEKGDHVMILTSPTSHPWVRNIILCISVVSV